MPSVPHSGLSPGQPWALKSCSSWGWHHLKLPPSSFPGRSSGKESACQCRRCRNCSFNPCIEKIPWRRKWQPTPVFLPGKSSWTGVWQACSSGVTKSQTRLKWQSTSANYLIEFWLAAGIWSCLPPNPFHECSRVWGCSHLIWSSHLDPCPKTPHLSGHPVTNPLLIDSCL